MKESLDLGVLHNKELHHPKIGVDCFVEIENPVEDEYGTVRATYDGTNYIDYERNIIPEHKFKFWYYPLGRKNAEGLIRSSLHAEFIIRNILDFK